MPSPDRQAAPTPRRTDPMVSLLIGEALIDIVAPVWERPASSGHVGGSPANVALALGRLATGCGC